MRKRQHLFLALGLVILLWLLDYLAEVFYLYWTTFWSDMIVHFFGGMSMAIFTIWLLGIHERSWVDFAVVFALVMAVGVAWEIFEYRIGETTAIEGHFLDVAADLIIDGLGVITAYLITMRSTSRSRESF